MDPLFHRFIEDFTNCRRRGMRAKQSGQPISPLAGEMSGRTEGGAKERRGPGKARSRP